MLNVSKGNMYSFVTNTWNVIKGKCPHDCEYCYMKMFKQRELHFDEKELLTDLGEGNVIFVGSSCDMFAHDVDGAWIKKVLDHCADYPNNRYLFQSKNPSRIFEFLGDIPDGSIIGTTIETNRQYPQMGKAVSPSERVVAMKYIRNAGFETMITIEPIMAFDLGPFVEMIREASPTWVNIGADSKHHNLPEPDKIDILALVSELMQFAEIKKKHNLGRLGL